MNRFWIWFLVGVGSAVAAFLPWVITGMRLPLQNLWGSDTLPDRMPVALLPFSQYYASLVAGILIIGFVIAALIFRARKGLVLPTVLGILLVQVVAVVQTTVVVHDGLSGRTASTIYLVALVAVCVVSIGLGVGILALLARATRPGFVVGATLAALALGPWLNGLLFPVGAIATYSVFSEVRHLLGTYLPALALGAAIAWMGVSSVARVVTAVASLLFFWIGGTFVLAGSVVAGTRVIAGQPAEMLDYGVSVFKAALGGEGVTLWAALVAALAAFLGIVARTVVARRTAA